MNNPNNRDNLPQIQQFLSLTKGIIQIFAIFEPFATYTISFLVETHRIPQIPQIFRIGHQHYSNFSNNTQYTLQLQASTQPTMLRTVLDHNPKCFYDRLAQLQAQMDSQYPLLLVLSIVIIRGVCNHKI